MVGPSEGPRGWGVNDTHAEVDAMSSMCRMGVICHPSFDRSYCSKYVIYIYLFHVYELCMCCVSF